MGTMNLFSRFASTAMEDSVFGPSYNGQFDFTLLFENVFMTIVPSCLLAVFCPFYIMGQYSRPTIANRNSLLWSKLVVAAVVVALEIARAVALCQVGYVREVAVLDNSAVAASVTAVAAAVAVVLMIYWEHVHAIRASSLVSLYLTLTVLLEATKTYSLVNRPVMNVAGALTMTITVVKGILVVMQEVPRQLKEELLVNGKVSNEVTGGFWNRTLVFWINSTLFIGFRRPLKIQDLAHIGPDYSSEALADRFERFWVEANKKAPNALLKTCIRTVFGPLVLAAFPRILFTGFWFTTPLLLRAALEQVNSTDSNKDAAKGLTAATALVFIGIGLSAASYSYMINRTATLLRGVLISQILKKNTRLPLSVTRQGASFTLMTADVDGIIAVIEKIHDFWIAFPELGLGLYLLSTVVGNAFFTPMIPIFFSLFLAWAIGRTMSPAATKWNQAIQKRVSNTTWILSQIKGLKMMGLEDVISSFIKALRIDEIASSADARWVRVLLMSIYPIEIWFSPMITITAGLFWTVWRDQLDAITLFTALGFLELLSDPTHAINAFWPELGVMYACFGRIQKFLLEDEHVDPRKLRDFRLASADQSFDEKTYSSMSDMSRHCISFNDVSVSSQNVERQILRQLSFSIQQGSLTLIVGPVGSGKTVLVKTLLGETNISSGTIETSSTNFAYCDQTPWLPDVSIKDAIIAEYDRDEVRYQDTIRACALDQDITNLAQGDQTLCGMNGSNLSGGQKQRVALARAVYSFCPVVVCDDVLSALDTATATSIFRNVFGPSGLLKTQSRTTIMATHMVEVLPTADKVISLNTTGTADIYDNPNVIAEFAASAQISAPQAAREADESPVNSNVANIQEDLKREAEEIASARRGTDLSVYKFLFQDVPKSLRVGFLLAIVLMAAMERFPGIYMRIWVSVDPSNKLYLIGMGLLGLLSIFMNSVTTTMFLMKIIPHIAQSMHDLFLTAVLKATLPFLTSTKNGTLINRFSQDMTLLSQDMPMSLFRLLYTTTLIVMNIGVIAAGADFASVLIPFLLAVLYALQAFYLRTSRQMRLLDLEAKSPLYTQLSETLTGIEHVRSYGWQSATIQKSLQLLDYSQTPFYYMYSIQRWLLLVLDMCAALMSTLLVAIAVLWTSTATQPSLGLALLAATQYSRTTRLWVVRWTALETSLGAVTRLQSFLKTTPIEKRHTFGANPEAEQDPEHVIEEKDLEPLRGWPQTGCIEFEDVNASYSKSSTSSKVLQDFSLLIPAGQSVALVGRTGSGKSSAVLSLLNFLDVTGTILIDGIDISQVSRQRLRSAITTIPQDPVILPGSVRDNLLPFTILGETTITSNQIATVEKALRDVGLWDHVAERGGLAASIDDMHFSAGQKQILGIARAIIHHQEGATKVILMDEISSNMDNKSDMRVQTLMNEAFAGCTRLTISHRPSGSSDCDIKVTLENGRITEVLHMAKAPPEP